MDAKRFFMLLLLPLAFSFQLLPLPVSETGVVAGSRRLLPAFQLAACRGYRRQSSLLTLRGAELPAVPVPPSQVDRAIVPGQRREIHIYAPADVAAVRKAR